MIAAVNIALVFATTGNGTWFAFLIATIGVVLVSLCIKPFARLSLLLVRCMFTLLGA